MSPIEKFRSAVPPRLRSALVKAVLTYSILAALGAAYLLGEGVNGADLKDFSALQLVVLAAVVCPLIALAYAILEVTVEGAFRGLGFLLSASYRAILAWAKRLLGRSQ